MNCRPNHVARTFDGEWSCGSSSSTSVMSCPRAVRRCEMRPRTASTVCSCSARTPFSGVNLEKSAYVRGRCHRRSPIVRISIRSRSFAESSPIPGSAVTGSSSELLGLAVDACDCRTVALDISLSRSYVQPRRVSAVEGPPPRIKPKSIDDYLEQLSKSVFQAGISWRVVDAKWPTIKPAFRGFQVERVARMGDREIDTLASDPRALRGRPKNAAVVHNARAILDLE